MKITYDSEVDALYIRLLEGDHQCTVMRISEDMALNLTEGEQLVGIEILDTGRVFDGRIPASVKIEDISRVSAKRGAHVWQHKRRRVPRCVRDVAIALTLPCCLRL